MPAIPRSPCGYATTNSISKFPPLNSAVQWGEFCDKLHFTRQAFYKARRSRAHKEVKEAFVLACVREERETNPRAGTVKVHEAIKSKLAAADITCISTGEGFLFLALVMDMVAKDIIGWDISESLEADGAVRALKMAGRRLPKDAKVVAHSDRWCQYGSRKYLEVLAALGWHSFRTAFVIMAVDAGIPPPR